MRKLLSGSIFLKLFASYGVAFILIVIGGAAARFVSSSSPNIEISVGNVQRYAELIIRDIGDPPDADAAARIALETGLEIAVLGPGIRWSSDADLLEEADAYDDESPFSRTIFKEIGDWMIQVRRGPYRYVFSEFHSDRRFSLIVLLLITAMVISALGISYLLVWRLLMPINSMIAVARDFGVNDWKQRVNPKGTDELAVLGKTMDSMADRIERYIKSIQDLLAAISHELRSPLTRMKVSLEFIEDERVKNSLDEEIGTLDRLTGALLEQRRLTTQPGALYLEQVDVAEWIASATEPYLRAEAPVRLVKEGGDPKIRLDRARMDLVLRNLVENALRHAPGSPVTVRLRAENSGPWAFTLEVSDEGPGMPEELLNRIGEPFLLVDSSRSGSRLSGGFGLGLSIVRAVADAHGAAFSARNLALRGFAVTLRFPRNPELRML